MRLFLHLRVHYFLDPNFTSQTGLLNEEESRHAIKSLRVQPGDLLEVGNGNGSLYVCKVADVGKRQLRLAITDEKFIPPKDQTLTIALAPTKNTSRFEWFVEKATELGVDKIIPLQCVRSERLHVNVQRTERLALAASKQSLRPYLPKIDELTTFSEIIKHQAEIKCIAHCEKGLERTAVSSILNRMHGKSLCLLIGPEGDFTPEEIAEAKNAGFIGIDLGSNRLRTETAGIFVASLAAAFR